MESPSGSPEWLSFHTAAERPDLWDQVRSRRQFLDVWPEYNQHGDHTPAYFGVLFSRFADHQILVVDDHSSQVVARGRTIPFRWSGALADLPRGIDALGLAAVREDGAPTHLSALAAEVDPSAQGTGLSSLVLAAMAVVARTHGLTSLVAPVRPSWKDRYPLTPVERYATWTRPDSLPLDPWMRVHVRMGGRILRGEPHSLQISAPVESWESWTGMAFPDDGEYVFPGGLAPLTVAAGVGDYWEPNVWIQHELDRAQP